MQKHVIFVDLANSFLKSIYYLLFSYQLAKFGFDTAENEPSKVCWYQHPTTPPCDSSWVCKGIIADGCGTSSVFWNTWILIRHRGDITVFTYAECRLIGLIAFLPRIITSIPMDLLWIGNNCLPRRLASYASHERVLSLCLGKKSVKTLTVLRCCLR